MNSTGTAARREERPRARRLRNRALTAGVVATMAAAGLVATPPWARADDDNSDDFANWCKDHTSDCDYPVAPKTGTDEFDRLLYDICDEKGGGEAEPTKYTWHQKDKFLGDWMLFQPVNADGCEFVPDGEPIVQTGKDPKPYRNDRNQFTRNCAQTADAIVTTQYQDTEVKLYTVGTSVSVGGKAGLFGLAEVEWKVEFNFSYQWGTWTWKGQSFAVPPGYVGWLESTEDWGVMKGRYKLNFPHPLRGHYYWYTPQVTIEAPLKGTGTTNYQVRPMTDEEIKKMCPHWDWDGWDPRDDPSGNGGTTPPTCTSGSPGGPTGQPSSTPPSGTTGPTPTDSGTSKPPEWAAGQDYELGDRVTYGGHIYQCLRAHVSDAGWTPDRTPELWRRLS